MRDEFTTMRSRCAGTEFVLVLGNHDRPLRGLTTSLGIDTVVPVLDEPPFHFIHEPATAIARTDRDVFTIAGHLHPTVAIRSPSGDRITDRCFVAEEAVLVLPAFGSFTGGHRITPTDGMRCWIARDDGVAEVTTLLRHSSRPGRRAE